MNTIYLILFFIFGTIFGSFYTVVGLRLPKGQNFTTTRSMCDKCNHELKLYEMIPIFSYILQKGKCRYCNEKIDPMLPIMEISTGLLFAVSYYSFNFSYELFIALGIVSLMIIISVSDLTYLVIPDGILVFFSIYFIIIQIFNIGLKSTFFQIISGIILFLFMYLIMIIGNKIFKKESLGGGDIKLMFVFGLILDPLLGCVSIFLASLIALPISMILLIKQKENVIPFGPFLLISLAIIYFTKITPDMIINLLTI